MRFGQHQRTTSQSDGAVDTPILANVENLFIVMTSRYTLIRNDIIW